MNMVISVCFCLCTCKKKWKRIFGILFLSLHLFLLRIGFPKLYLKEKYVRSDYLVHLNTMITVEMSAIVWSE